MCILNFKKFKKMGQGWSWYISQSEKKYDISEKNGGILFSGVRQILDSGVVEDQRGFNGKWKAKLQGNKIVGVFEQPLIAESSSCMKRM